jgi:DNA-binding transcriptional LysR family regulator
MVAVAGNAGGRQPGQHFGHVGVDHLQSLAGSAGNLQAVIDGSMDIALTASPADPGPSRPPRGVLLTPLVSEPLVFVCPAGHRLSQRGRVTATDLAEETILRFPPGWGIRATVDAVLGADPSAIEIGDYALMLTLVRSRFGTTLLPASAITHGHPGVVAVSVDDPRLAWDLSAAISASRQPTAAATALLTALTQAVAGPAWAGAREDTDGGVTAVPGPAPTR